MWLILVIFFIIVAIILFLWKINRNTKESFSGCSNIAGIKSEAVSLIDNLKDDVSKIEGNQKVTNPETGKDFIIDRTILEGWDGVEEYKKNFGSRAENIKKIINGSRDLNEISAQLEKIFGTVEFQPETIVNENINNAWLNLTRVIQGTNSKYNMEKVVLREPLPYTKEAWVLIENIRKCPPPPPPAETTHPPPPAETTNPPPPPQPAETTHHPPPPPPPQTAETMHPPAETKHPPWPLFSTTTTHHDETTHPIVTRGQHDNSRISGFGQTATTTDPNANDTHTTTDPNANDTHTTTDPNANDTHTTTDPNATDTHTTTDPNATDTHTTTDPNKTTDPNETTDTHTTTDPNKTTDTHATNDSNATNDPDTTINPNKTTDPEPSPTHTSLKSSEIKALDEDLKKIEEELNKPGVSPEQKKLYEQQEEDIKTEIAVKKIAETPEGEAAVEEAELSNPELFSKKAENDNLALGENTLKAINQVKNLEALNDPATQKLLETVINNADEVSNDIETTDAEIFYNLQFFDEDTPEYKAVESDYKKMESLYKELNEEKSALRAAIAKKDRIEVLTQLKKIAKTEENINSVRNKMKLDVIKLYQMPKRKNINKETDAVTRNYTINRPKNIFIIE